MENTVNELTAQRNAIDAKIMAIEKKIMDSNYEKFVEEIMNLRDNAGKGFTAGDYYAGNRYYSEIPGVKNLRWCNYDENGNPTSIDVKITSPKGMLIPRNVEIGDWRLTVIFTESKNYDPTVDY